MKLLEAFSFFFRYLRNPSSVGAVCPSSRFLARKMVEPVKSVVGDNDVIIELGSGTGAITEYIFSELKSDFKKLYCVEFDKQSAKILSEKFSSANVVNDSAENIVQILGSDIENLKCVVSSLPLLSLPEQCVDNILQAVEASLPKGGVFVQFTYNLAKSPAMGRFKKMKKVSRSFVFANLPPARVDVFVRQ